MTGWFVPICHNVCTLEEASSSPHMSSCSGRYGCSLLPRILVGDEDEWRFIVWKLYSFCRFEMRVALGKCTLDLVTSVHFTTHHAALHSNGRLVLAGDGPTMYAVGLQAGPVIMNSAAAPAQAQQQSS